jgi:hypothetical protein
MKLETGELGLPGELAVQHVEVGHRYDLGFATIPHLLMGELHALDLGRKIKHATIRHVLLVNILFVKYFNSIF